MIYAVLILYKPPTESICQALNIGGFHKCLIRQHLLTQRGYVLRGMSLHIGMLMHAYVMYENVWPRMPVAYVHYVLFTRFTFLASFLACWKTFSINIGECRTCVNSCLYADSLLFY